VKLDDGYEGDYTQPGERATYTPSTPNNQEIHIMSKLKDRLNPAELSKRADALATRGTWRQEMEKAHAMTRGGVNACAKGIEMVFLGHKTTRRLVYALLAAEAVEIVARLAGLF
jgi:hypothetical protein